MTTGIMLGASLEVSVDDLDQVQVCTRPTCKHRGLDDARACAVRRMTEALDALEPVGVAVRARGRHVDGSLDPKVKLGVIFAPFVAGDEHAFDLRLLDGSHPRLGSCERWSFHVEPIRVRREVLAMLDDHGRGGFVVRYSPLEDGPSFPETTVHLPLVRHSTLSSVLKAERWRRFAQRSQRFAIHVHEGASLAPSAPSLVSKIEEEPRSFAERTLKPLLPEVPRLPVLARCACGCNEDDDT